MYAIRSYYGVVARFEERVQAGGLRAGKTKRGAGFLCAQAKALGGGRRGAEGAVGAGRVPEPVMGGHDGHADTGGHFKACHQGQNEIPAGAAA